MLSEAQMVRVTGRYMRVTRSYADAAARVMGEAWDRLDSWERADAARLARMANPTVSILSGRATAATQGYYGILLQSPVTFAPPIVTPDWDSALIALRKSLAEGNEWEQALHSGRLRAEQVGTNAVIGSARIASDSVISEQVVGYRRVTSANSCRWCQTVSTQRYRTAESASFGHGNCHCGVVPIIGEADPGRVINQQLLDQVNAER